MYSTQTFYFLCNFQLSCILVRVISLYDQSFYCIYVINLLYVFPSKLAVILTHLRSMSKVDEVGHKPLAVSSKRKNRKLSYAE